MSVISDLLGVEHFTTARGSTVRKDFLEAVAAPLGVTSPEERGKDSLLGAVIEAATHRPMDPALFSTGGTVTDAALQRIIDGLMEHGSPGRPSPTPDEHDRLASEDDLEGIFDPATISDERDRRLALLAARQGQDTFRTAVLEAYGSQCAVTRYDAVDALEAAHIYPYRGPATSTVSNGLCLRADVHTLFDRGALAIHETTLQVLLKPHLAITAYADLEGVTIAVPHQMARRPSTAALRSHREWAGLG
jgi:putative restriction endonuclease